MKCNLCSPVCKYKFLFQFQTDDFSADMNGCEWLAVLYNYSSCWGFFGKPYFRAAYKININVNYQSF